MSRRYWTPGKSMRSIAWYARERAYAGIEQIDFPGAQFRADVAKRAVHVAG